MKYLVDVNGSRRDVDVVGGVAANNASPDDVLDSEAAGATLDPSAGTPARTLRVGDRVVRVVVRARGGKGSYVLDIDGHRYTVEALDERTRVIQEMTARNAPPSGPAPIVAPMPGLVVRVNVRPGDDVTAGQSVVVMEAMKMENELRATVAATVKAVLAQPGTAVEKGALLLELE